MSRDGTPENVVSPPIKSWEGGGGNGGGDHYWQRLARLEEKVEHLATKSDIQEVKTLIAQRESSMQRWLLGIILAASTTIAIAFIRLFFN